MRESRPDEKQITTFKDKYYEKSNILKKAPRGGWKFIMSREEKRFRTRWNTETRPYKPTPKGKIGEDKKKEEKK